ncbi:MAG: DUF6259 domain-containing protein [Kiritimatiellia bacterium]
METFYLKNGGRICIDFKNSAVKSLLFQGTELICGEAPLFSLKLRDASGAHRILSARSFAFLSFKNGKAKYSHPEADVTLRLKKCSRAGLSIRMDVKNKTKDLLEWVQPFCFALPGKLKDEGGTGEIVFPYNEGCLVTDLGKRNESWLRYAEPEYPSQGKYAIFPNMVSSQFIGFLHNGIGIYMGMHDPERTVKQIDFKCENDSLHLLLRTFCDVDFAQDYKMPFDLVVRFFEGDCFDCAEIYRKWFYRHLPEGLHKIAGEPLPEWYAESPIVVTYPVRGKHDIDEITPNPALYPYSNALPILSEISNATGAAVMALLMHWEGSAPWAPPYVWPPFGGEACFEAFVEESHRKGFLVGVYCSGLGWTQKSKLMDYSRTEEFEKKHLKDIMCTDTDGTMRSVTCTYQREGYDMCPSSKRCRELLVSEYNKIVASGIDYIQVLDQNHGGNAYFCYNRRHGHTPAPGKWQISAVNNMLSGINGRDHVLLGCETAAAEPFLATLKFSDNRWNLNGHIGKSIPLYAYLYHEFVNNFMGNQIGTALSDEERNYTYRAAYSFLAGDSITLVLRHDGQPASSWGKDKKVLDKGVVYPFLRELTNWRKGAGKDFLHKGKMVKPQHVVCGKNRFTRNDGSAFWVDQVLTTSYRYRGKRVQFLVNYNTIPVSVSFEKKVLLYTNARLENGKRVQSTTLAPLTVALIRG